MDDYMDTNNNKSSNESKLNINSGNSGDIIINQINSINFDSVDIEQLKEIAESLGIRPVSDQTKSVLYQRICLFRDYRESLLEKKEIENSMNPFSKERPELDDTLSIETGELLFWRVFRDKYLFNMIFSNFIYSKVFPYRSLIYIDRILRDYSNGENILRDKVKCGSYMVFGNLGRHDPTSNKVVLIYHTIIKDNKENLDFYNQLFKNYSKHFIQINLILESIISSYNLVAFKAYIQYLNNYNNNNNNTRNSIGLVDYSSGNDNDNGNGNDDCIGSYINIKKILDLSFNNATHQIESLDSLKCYLFIQSHYNFTDSQLKLCIQVFKKSFKIKDLFKLIKFLVNNFVVKEMYYIRPSDLDSIKQLFTKEQLGMNIRKIIKQFVNNSGNNNGSEVINSGNSNNSNNINNKLKIVIRNMVKLYYSVSNAAKPLEYYSVFCGPDTIFQKTSGYTVSYDDDIQFNKDLLVYCGYSIGSRERTELCRKFVGSKHELDIRAFRSSFAKLVNKGDLELIGLYLRYGSGRSLFQVISSTNALDYLFMNYKKQKFYQERNPYWLELSSVELLEHYENQMKSVSKKIIVDEQLIDNISFTRPLILLQIFQRVKENSSNVYQVDSQQSIDSVLAKCVKGQLQTGFKSQEVLLDFLKSFNIKYFNLTNLHLQVDFGHGFYKVAHWLLNSYSTIIPTTIKSPCIIPNSDIPDEIIPVFEIIVKSPTDNSKSTTFCIKRTLLVNLCAAANDYDVLFKLDPSLMIVNDSNSHIWTFFCKEEYLERLLDYCFYKISERISNDCGSISSGSGSGSGSISGISGGSGSYFSRHLKASNLDRIQILWNQLLSTHLTSGNLKIFQVVLLDYIYIFSDNKKLSLRILLTEAISSGNLDIIDLILSMYLPDDKEDQLISSIVNIYPGKSTGALNYYFLKKKSILKIISSSNDNKSLHL